MTQEIYSDDFSVGLKKIEFSSESNSGSGKTLKKKIVWHYFNSLFLRLLFNGCKALWSIENSINAEHSLVKSLPLQTAFQYVVLI